ncbi:UDP-glucuronosyltransferase 2A1-like isoform X2 [Pseudorasbora parva]|uniref:UDP-glucuronosyltransferase 2A1-like isoform X2 n=1 Tax=Pseudorasbora parva TaxID=51549 RepID=UPI00351F20D5
MRLVLFLSLLTVFSPTECGNILVWYTEGSHWINLKIVLETLIDRGHNVTVLVPDASLFMKAKESDRFSYQPFSVSMDEQEMRQFIEEFLHFSVYEMDELSLLQITIKFYQLASKYHDISLAHCDGILKSPELMDKLRNGKFDVVLSDPIYACSDIVAEELDIPLVYTFRFSIAHTAERMCGQIPAPPSFVPGAMSKLTDKMSFTERIINMLFYLSQDALAISLWKKIDNYYTEYLGRPTSYCEMMGKADIWLIRTYWDFEFPRPFLPNFKYIGGLHCTPAKPLPKDMEEFVQSSGDDGIVVFTLGSLIDKMPNETSNRIASALAQIPQKVLWRYGGEKPDTLGENTRIYKWIPQNDLLGHPKTRAFITHGGTNGIYEAIYHAVPMVGIPLFGDQPDNLAHMKAKGVAVVMDFNRMQIQDLVDGLSAVINNPSYKENAMRLSRIHHDRPMKPLDESVFWIEFVMRNKGRPTSYCEMMGKADIWLIRTYWDFEFPRPFLPNFKYIGGLHCTPAKPLPKDMEEFVQSSGDDGIVVFTLGSLIDKMPNETSNRIASALAQIPQKVLWRYGGEKPDTLGENTRIYKWIPQNDLLGHPKTRAFITHGGTNGIYEAIYHAVPMVGIPLFGDQPDNLAHMKAKGVAVIMDNIKTMQPQELVDGLNAVINDPSYKENATRLSRIHHDRPMKPLDESVFWIEFVMRNKDPIFTCNDNPTVNCSGEKDN